jgi:hypothetical protein
MNTIKNIEIIQIKPGEVDDENEQPSTTGFYAVRDADDSGRELGLFNYHVPGLSSPFASGAYPTQAVAEKNARDFATLMRVNLPANQAVTA